MTNLKLHPSKIILLSKIDLCNFIEHDETQKRDTGSTNFEYYMMYALYHNEQIY